MKFLRTKVEIETYIVQSNQSKIQKIIGQNLSLLGEFSLWNKLNF